MRVYRFRLASVARIRALEESVAREKFMLALRDLRRAQEMKRSAEAALVAFESPTGIATIEAIQWSGDQAHRLSESIRAFGEKVEVAESACLETRRLWNEASKRSSMLTRLDNQSRTRWQNEMLREEVAELDDITNSRYQLLGDRI